MPPAPHSLPTVRTGNCVRDIEVSGANHAILALCQSGMRISGLYSHDHFDSSGAVNPTHGIYMTGAYTTSQFHYDLVVSNCVCVNNAYGTAFQFKCVHGAWLQTCSPIIATACLSVGYPGFHRNGNTSGQRYCQHRADVHNHQGVDAASADHRDRRGDHDEQ